MKMYLTVLLLLLFSSIMSQNIVLNPTIKYIDHPEISIEKILISDTSTILCCKYIAVKHGETIWVDTNDLCYKFFIVANQKKYFIQYIENINNSPKSVTKNIPYFFKLFFPPLPPNINYIDIFEGEIGPWNFHKVQLNNTE